MLVQPKAERDSNKSRGPARTSPLPRHKTGGTDGGKCQQSVCEWVRSQDKDKSIHVYGRTDWSPKGQKQDRELSCLRTCRFVVLQNETSQNRDFYIDLLWGSMHLPLKILSWESILWCGQLSCMATLADPWAEAHRSVCWWGEDICSSDKCHEG